jgi:uncharacterized protein YndB with AHSA1/START domain
VWHGSISLIMAVLCSCVCSHAQEHPEAIASDHQRKHTSAEQMLTLHATRRSDHEIVLMRSFAAPREVVFDAMTRPEHLLQWMHASGMELAVCEVDPRVGGTFRYVFQRANGRRLEVRGMYESFDRPDRYVYRESYDFSPLQILVTVALEDTGGTTLFRQTLRYASLQERDDDFEGVVTSATEAYANLDRYLSQDRR